MNHRLSKATLREASKVTIGDALRSASCEETPVLPPNSRAWSLSCANFEHCPRCKVEVEAEFGRWGPYIEIRCSRCARLLDKWFDPADDA